MSTRLYTVALTDLGTYRVTVAADTPEEACRIGKNVLHDEATQLPPDTQIVKRETDAIAEVAPEQSTRQFEVEGVFQLVFETTVPASDSREAERHVRRLYEAYSGPFEFVHDGGRLVRVAAQEVRS